VKSEESYFLTTNAFGTTAKSIHDQIGKMVSEQMSLKEKGLHSGFFKRWPI